MNCLGVVYVAVPTQSLYVREAATTASHCALERLLPGVGALVCPQHAGEAEAFATYFTHVGFLISLLQ